MFSKRNEGYHAVIRSGRLFVEGLEWNKENAEQLEHEIIRRKEENIMQNNKRINKAVSAENT